MRIFVWKIRHMHRPNSCFRIYTNIQFGAIISNIFNAFLYKKYVIRSNMNNVSTSETRIRNIAVECFLDSLSGRKHKP